MAAGAHRTHQTKEKRTSVFGDISRHNGHEHRPSGAGSGDANDNTGAHMKLEDRVRVRENNETQDLGHSGYCNNAPRTIFIRERPNKWLRQSPKQVLQRQRKRKCRQADSERFRNRCLEKSKTVPRAHREQNHKGRRKYDDIIRGRHFNDHGNS